VNVFNVAQVSGVLDEQKQAPTPTAYFAVLMTALSSPQSLATAPPAPAKKGRREPRKGSRAKQAAEADDDTPSVAAALLHLLHLVLPEYPLSRSFFVVFLVV
jgi:hypothetical protein